MRARPKKASACVDVREQRSLLTETTDGGGRTPTRLRITLDYSTAPATMSFAGVNREQPAFLQCVCDCPSLVLG